MTFMASINIHIIINILIVIININDKVSWSNDRASRFVTFDDFIAILTASHASSFDNIQRVGTSTFPSLI